MLLRNNTQLKEQTRFIPNGMEVYGYDNTGRPIVDWDGETYYVYDLDLGKKIKATAKVLAGAMIGAYLAKSVSDGVKRAYKFTAMTQDMANKNFSHGEWALSQVGVHHP